MRIDSHNHFWIFDPIRFDWIDQSMHKLKKDFLPDDLISELRENNIHGTVAVQAEQSENETEFLLDLAESYKFIEGVVGWLDLSSPNVEDSLAVFYQKPKLVGLRHIVQAEPDPEFLLKPAFQNGLSKLEPYGLTYDILIFPNQLEAAIATVRKLSNQRFVLDHLAKPYIKEGKIEKWKKDIHELAKSDNVLCKLSGLVTEGDWKNWKESDFHPYMDAVVESFGIDRIMFGSDWPVCKVAAEYHQVLGIIETYFREYSRTEKEKIFGGNAIDFYNLKIDKNE